MKPNAKSCTKFIKAIAMQYDDKEILICDSPGLEDSRGPEIDISNMYGLIKSS